jgi:hypothetical protein
MVKSQDIYIEKRNVTFMSQKPFESISEGFRGNDYDDGPKWIASLDRLKIKGQRFLKFWMEMTSRDVKHIRIDLDIGLGLQPSWTP